MRVEIYSDVVCPWCYIGERRFGRALASFPGAGEVQVVFRPYQLDPEAPEVAVPQAEYMEKRFGKRGAGILTQVTAAAASEGISIDWERALAANTRTAHRLLRLAEREYGAVVQRALAEKLFALHFSQGGNVADPGQLAAAAAEAGMERARVEGYLASREGEPELAEELASARRMGIRAVPTFVFEGKWAVEGAQSAEAFAEALAEVARSTTPDAGPESGDGACEGDACLA